ncbi:hypothetical protein DEFDS_P056 (plasmid) [Deferribacter desulfuricans SSM1]|uniref:Uncharacterized protein n=1 Tax=Deferribacter desulfuricans (strain DSM 14783 / JCM 11476 / NBRC 101012 / SSM1) TaxID=639282 RepID=D3PEN8_DEFDS|nr:hypothetical protein [Deferribacter desulfuricans]BAI81680.1 hypothetical protein DEFDS_P056 [Deferribacter desulfuricans SSM1]
MRFFVNKPRTIIIIYIILYILSCITFAFAEENVKQLHYIISDINEYQEFYIPLKVNGNTLQDDFIVLLSPDGQKVLIPFQNLTKLLKFGLYLHRVNDNLYILQGYFLNKDYFLNLKTTKIYKYKNVFSVLKFQGYLVNDRQNKTVNITTYLAIYNNKYYISCNYLSKLFNNIIEVNYDPINMELILKTDVKLNSQILEERKKKREKYENYTKQLQNQQTKDIVSVKNQPLLVSEYNVKLIPYAMDNTKNYIDSIELDNTLNYNKIVFQDYLNYNSQDGININYLSLNYNLKKSNVENIQFEYLKPYLISDVQYLNKLFGNYIIDKIMQNTIDMNNTSYNSDVSKSIVVEVNNYKIDYDDVYSTMDINNFLQKENIFSKYKLNNVFHYSIDDFEFYKNKDLLFNGNVKNIKNELNNVDLHYGMNAFKMSYFSYILGEYTDTYIINVDNNYPKKEQLLYKLRSEIVGENNYRLIDFAYGLGNFDYIKYSSFNLKNNIYDIDYQSISYNRNYYFSKLYKQFNLDINLFKLGDEQFLKTNFQLIDLNGNQNTLTFTKSLKNNIYGLTLKRLMQFNKLSSRITIDWVKNINSTYLDVNYKLNYNLGYKVNITWENSYKKQKYTDSNFLLNSYNTKLSFYYNLTKSIRLKYAMEYNYNDLKYEDNLLKTTVTGHVLEIKSKLSNKWELTAEAGVSSDNSKQFMFLLTYKDDKYTHTVQTSSIHSSYKNETEMNYTINGAVFTTYSNVDKKILNYFYKTNTTGILLIKPFIDINGNDKYDKNEDTVVQNLKFKIDNNVIRVDTFDVKNGYYVIYNVPYGKRHYLSIDEKSIEDPYISPVNKFYSFKLDKQDLNIIFIPFVYYGEIFGYVDSIIAHATNNCFVELRNSKTGKIHRSEIFEDFSYYFQKVPLGGYLLQLVCQKEGKDKIYDRLNVKLFYDKKLNFVNTSVDLTNRLLHYNKQ